MRQSRHFLFVTRARTRPSKGDLNIEATPECRRSKVDQLRKATSRNALAALLAGAATLGVSVSARADNLLGLYIGGGVGESHVRSDTRAFSNLNGFVENRTAWKALVGVRPISLLGAELEYTDFGHPGESNVGPLPPGIIYNVDVSQKATSLFGLLYWPLPLPIFDIYGKAGFARLQTDTNVSWRCVAPVTCVANPSYQQSSTDTRFAYGVGAQAKFLALGVRAEYERISAPGGSPDLFSLVATYTF
jgi:opacity protein-like surface antigen